MRDVRGRGVAAAVGAVFAFGLACGGGKQSAIFVTCDDDAQTLLGSVGTTYRVDCPAMCDGGTIYGTDVYTDDSNLCGAALHAGVIDSSGGAFTVTIAAGQKGYKGSTRNGITSEDWTDAWERSFTVSK